jgi:predicted DNA-binding transcriptional regulator AlpA
MGLGRCGGSAVGSPSLRSQRTEFRRELPHSEDGGNSVIEQYNALTPGQASKYLGVSEAALRLWRSRGEGPRHFRAGEKLIRYRRADLDSWIETRLSEPSTSSISTER